MRSQWANAVVRRTAKQSTWRSVPGWTWTILKQAEINKTDIFTNSMDSHKNKNMIVANYIRYWSYS